MELDRQYLLANWCGRHEAFGDKVSYKNISVGIALAAFLCGCATSEKVEERQIGDSSLTCDQIKAEYVKLDAAQKDVDSKRGVNTTNVAGALFWLPGLAYTFYDAGQADDAIRHRRDNLTDLYDQKKCR